MDGVLERLLTQLYAGVITKGQFLNEYFQIRSRSAEDLMVLLQQGISSKDADAVEEVIAVLLTKHFDLKAFLLALCKLLTENWHTKHEDIVALIETANMAEAAFYLYEAAGCRFEYLDYDHTNQFARKCIKVLAAIGNENALNYLKLLANSSDPIIKTYAQKELRYKGL